MVCVLTAEWANGPWAADSRQEYEGGVRHSARRCRTVLFVGLLATALMAVALAGIVSRRWFERRGVPSRASRPTVTTKVLATGRPTLWVLAIGVSRYTEPGLDLRFAAADAKAMAAAFAQQQGGPLYGEVKTDVLVDRAASRAGILRALDDFLGQAAPIDVGIVYLAGHGVRDEVLDGYYFLPSTASPETPRIDGLDMDEFNREVHLLHRNLRRLVVILDTCHAGAALRSPTVHFGEDLAARLPPAEGLYILAAAKSGERSREMSGYGHGAFTQALLDGVAGAAADPDGLIRVLGLASYAARVVPEMTGRAQTPYLSIMGGDLPIAAQPEKFAQVTPPPLPSPMPAASPAARERVAIMNFENLRPNREYDWMQQVLGEQFTTTLHQVSRFDVYDERMVRFLARGATDPIEASRRADMTKLVNGAYWVQKDRISITAHVKSTNPLRPLASAEIEGPVEQLSQLSARVAIRLLEQLHVQLAAADVDRLMQGSASDLGARKLLFDAERPAAAQPTPIIKPHASLGGWLHLAAASYAAENPNPEVELRAALEEYREAFERGNIDALARFYVAFAPTQRAALKRYFDNADDLRVEFSDVQIAIIGDRAAVSFNREDHFVDHQTGETQQVVARVTKLFAHGAEGWQIVPEE
jgi:TolB-like protein/ketosteroid isomerase-like protein